MNSQVSTTSTEIKLSPSKFDLKRIVLNRIGRLLPQPGNQSTDLQVWQEFDQERCYWSAYDPRTKRSIYHISEAEMRAWIEQRTRVRRSLF